MRPARDTDGESGHINLPTTRSAVESTQHFIQQICRCWITGRQSTDPNAEAVVFLLGMRMNRLRSAREITQVAVAMTRMLTELFRHGDLGLMSARTFVSGRDILLVQYWRSAEELQAYARSDRGAHLPAWRAFNQALRKAANVGIWHETYRVGPGMYEAIYVNMPAFGLAAATGGPQPIITGRHSAAARLNGGADNPVLDPDNDSGADRPVRSGASVGASSPA